MDYLVFLRQFKIGPFAIFDLLVSYLGIFLLAPLLTKLFSIIKISVPTSSWLWFTLPLSVIFHLLFHQPTALMKILSDPSQSQFYPAVIILLLMIYLGFKNIRRLA